MKVIMTIKRGNKDEKNFTRELDMTPQEYDYIKNAASVINCKGGEDFIGVYVHQI